MESKQVSKYLALLILESMVLTRKQRAAKQRSRPDLSRKEFLIFMTFYYISSIPYVFRFLHSFDSFRSVLTHQNRTVFLKLRISKFSIDLNFALKKDKTNRKKERHKVIRIINQYGRIRRSELEITISFWRLFVCFLRAYFNAISCFSVSFCAGDARVPEPVSGGDAVQRLQGVLDA